MGNGQLGVSRLVAVLPKQIEVAVLSYFFEDGFCWHRIGG
jgi:hypothetical protein